MMTCKQVAILNEEPCNSIIIEKKKKQQKKLNIKKSFTSVWLLVYVVSSLYRYIRCDETMLLSITWFQTRGTRKFDERSGVTSAYKG